MRNNIECPNQSARAGVERINAAANSGIGAGISGVNLAVKGYGRTGDFITQRAVGHPCIPKQCAVGRIQSNQVTIGRPPKNAALVQRHAPIARQMLRIYRHPCVGPFHRTARAIQREDFVRRRHEHPTVMHDGTGFKAAHLTQLRDAFDLKMACVGGIDLRERREAIAGQRAVEGQPVRIRYVQQLCVFQTLAACGQHYPRCLRKGRGRCQGFRAGSASTRAARR